VEIDNDVSTEASRAVSAELSLTNNLSAEASRATSAETALNNDLSIEVVRATSVETNLGSVLSSEISRVTAAFSAEYSIHSMVVVNDVTAGSFTSASDARLKTDVAEISNALEMVTHMRPVTYNWIDETRTKVNPAEKEIGVIAQEMEMVLPNIVATDADGMKRVAYDRLVAVLIGAVKDLKAEVDALKRA
jgi:hypothetical protein